jgi:cytochrome P450
MEAYPHVQTELRSALRAAFGESNTVPSVSEMLDTDIPYLDATCEESFRFAGVAKGNLRQALVDTEILGYQIPKGAELFMNYHVDHAPLEVDAAKRTPASRAAIEKHGNGFRTVAARDLAMFEPRRWVTRDEETGKEVFNAYALPSLAFGGGFRGCSGAFLALLPLAVDYLLFSTQLYRAD